MRNVLVAALLLAAAAAPATAQPEKVKTRSAAARAAILAAANDPNRDVRARVAWVLGQLIPAETDRAVLEKLAADPAPEVRAGALRSLAATLPAGTRINVKVSPEPDQAGLRIAALDVARTLFFPGRDELIADALLKGDITQRALAVAALAADPPAAARPRLLAALKDDSPVVQRAALLALAQQNNAADAALATTLLHDGAGVVRAAAVEALARLAPKTAHAALVGALKDEYFLVRRTAVQRLVSLDDRQAVAALQASITDHDFTVREQVGIALGVMRVASSAPLLADRLADDVLEVRIAAQEALFQFPPNEAAPAALKYIDYMKLVDTRHRAWEVLGAAAYPPTAEVSAAHLKDKDPAVRTCALRVLRKLKDPRALPYALSVVTPKAIQTADNDEAGEAFLTARDFGSREAVATAMECLKLTLNPPLEPVWLPGQPMTMGAAHYLAGVGHKPAAPLLRGICGMFENMPFGREMAAALKQLTGEVYVPAAAPHAGPSTEVFFIDVAPPAAKGTTKATKK